MQLGIAKCFSMFVHLYYVTRVALQSITLVTQKKPNLFHHIK